MIVHRVLIEERAAFAFCACKGGVGLPTRFCVSVVGEGQAGPREEAPALRKLRGGAGTCSTVWGLGLQGVCVWCMERLSTRVSTPGAPPVAVATATAARAARRSRIRWGLFTEAFFLVYSLLKFTLSCAGHYSSLL